MDPVINKDI